MTTLAQQDQVTRDITNETNRDLNKCYDEMKALNDLVQTADQVAASQTPALNKVEVCNAMTLAHLKEKLETTNKNVGKANEEIEEGLENRRGCCGCCGKPPCCQIL